MSDPIDRQAAINTAQVMYERCDEDIEGYRDLMVESLKVLPSAQPDLQLTCNQFATDCISRQAAIRWVKTECNPYGKPTLEFESGKKVIKHLEQMPSAQPEQIKMIKEIRKWINSGNRGNADYFIVDKIEEIINKYE